MKKGKGSISGGARAQEIILKDCYAHIAHRPTLDLVRNAMENNIIVAATCHAQWILVSADVVKGRRITCPIRINLRA